VIYGTSEDFIPSVGNHKELDEYKELRMPSDSASVSTTARGKEIDEA
jgi:hypothetical protein